MRELDVHPGAAFFPHMDAETFKKFRADIKANGVREAIWLWEGQIIDGLHRYRACQELGVECPTRQWNGYGSLAAFVVSLNLHRRHLSASQLAAAAARALPRLREEAQERQAATQIKDGTAPVRQKIASPSEGKAVEVAGRMLGVNPEYVRQAAKLKEEDPEVFAEIEAGRETIAKAVRARNELRGVRNIGRAEFAADAASGVRMVKCPHCGGKGYVPA